jgi:hypothetical protein
MGNPTDTHSTLSSAIGQRSRVLIPAPFSPDPATVRATREVSPVFDPAAVRMGDHIGWLTAFSEPVPRNVHVGCHHLAHPSTWPDGRASAIRHYGEWVAEYWPKDQPQMSCLPTASNEVIYHADMLCSCGWIIHNVELTGDPMTQKLSCGHHRGMPPDHFHAKTFAANRNARRLPVWTVKGGFANAA